MNKNVSVHSLKTLVSSGALHVGSYCIRFVQQAGVTFASIGGESSASAEPKLLLSQALSTHSEYV